MKDLRFYSGDGKAVNVTFRTDAIQNSGNFTVMSISGINLAVPPGNLLNHELLAGFKKLAYNFQDFIAFAQNNALFLSSADSNGANLSVLVVGTDSIGS